MNTTTTTTTKPLARRVHDVDEMPNDLLLSFAALLDRNDSAAHVWGAPVAIVLARRGLDWPSA